MPRTIPCLWFDGDAEQAAELYISVFSDSKVLGTTRYGPDMPGEEGSVAAVSFSLDGQEYVGLNGGPEFTFTEAVSFQIMCADQEEVDYYWSRLSEGGDQGPCGWLKDRFGLSWQVIPTVLIEMENDPDPDRAQRATQAMLKMGKIDIAELHRAVGDTPPTDS